MSKEILADYYGFVREAVMRDDDRINRITLEGMSAIAALLSLGGFLFGTGQSLAVSFLAVGNIVLTISLIFMRYFYAGLLGAALEVASRLDDLMFDSSMDAIKLSRRRS